MVYSSNALNRRFGFTLVELLVVIAVIALLAAVIFPVFAQARAKARQTACLSNLKQIGMALLSYTQDFDETFPPAFGGWSVIDGQTLPLYWAPQTTTTATGGKVAVPGILTPYVKSTALFRCPSTSPDWPLTYMY